MIILGAVIGFLIVCGIIGAHVTPPSSATPAATVSSTPAQPVPSSATPETPAPSDTDTPDPADTAPATTTGGGSSHHHVTVGSCVGHKILHVCLRS